MNNSNPAVNATNSEDPEKLKDQKTGVEPRLVDDKLIGDDLEIEEAQSEKEHEKDDQPSGANY